MSDINYKNVYNLAPYEKSIFAAQRKVIQAEQAVELAKKTYQQKCAQLAEVPLEELEFSNDMCMAHAIASHVYHIKHRTQYGSAQNKCIFCGCDNVQD